MLRDVAAKRLDQLDALPRDVGERIRDLREYDFLEPDARDRFDELVERLGKQVLDQFVGGHERRHPVDDAGGPRRQPRDGPRPQRAHPRADRRPRPRTSASSSPSTAGSSRAPRRFDDIIDQLAQRMAAMQSLHALDEPGAARRAPVDDGGAAARRPAPASTSPSSPRTWTCCCPAASATGSGSSGDEPLSLDGALAQIARLQAMERLEDALTDVDAPGDLADIDRDQVRELLGDDAVRDLDALDDLARRLEEAGYLTRDGDRLELTPRGSRKIGQKVLDDLFARLAARRVRRPSRRPRRPRRRARGDDQAVRVRRPVPPRPARDAHERAGARGERAGPARRAAASA